jgi:hypothetical protein
MQLLCAVYIYYQRSKHSFGAGSVLMGPHNVQPLTTAGRTSRPIKAVTRCIKISINTIRCHAMGMLHPCATFTVDQRLLQVKVDEWSRSLFTASLHQLTTSQTPTRNMHVVIKSHVVMESVQSTSTVARSLECWRAQTHRQSQAPQYQ